jgi:hypothetical protein
MKKTARKNAPREERSTQLPIALSDVVREDLRAFVVNAGVAALAEMLERERTEACGPRGTLSSISGKKQVVRIEQIAAAALARDALEVRSLLQDLARDCPDWSRVPRPEVIDAKVLAVAAAFTELLAARNGQPPPPWTREVAGLAEPIFLVGSQTTLPRTRRRIEEESREPFKRRNIFVPANYASAA